ncbi:MAG TPA: contractile injection system tape measure protein, partial [Bacteroidia bacterium]|nr:contractile injection system tape measure protein [Bacteroidia bacterium]
LLLRTMNEIFDSLVDENEVVRIDKLEINLGNISSQHLEYELPEKIKKEIEDALAKLLYEVRHSPDRSAEVRIETAGGDTITVQADVQQKSFSLFETLIYFLEFGVLPWTKDRKEKPTLRFLLAQAMEKHSDQLRQVLRQLSGKSYVFRRLAFQVPEEQLQYLAAILGSGFSSKLPAYHNELQKWIELICKQTGNNAKVKSVKAISRDQLRFFFWEETLRYFSANSGSQHTSDIRSDTIFLSEIIRKAISHFEIKIKTAKVERWRYKGNAENAFELAIKNLLKETLEIELQQKKKSAEQQGGIKEELIPEQNKQEELLRKRKESEESIARQNKEKQDEIDRLLKSRKEEHPQAPEVEEGIYIDNAGLVILSPYIPGFFRNVGFVNGKEFVDEASKWRAVHMLQWLVDGGEKKQKENKDEETEITEHDLVLNKIFCGIDIAEPVPVSIELSEKEKEEGINLLKAVIQNWEIIKRSSVHSLRTTFLQKQGKIKRVDQNWDLFIQRDSGVDMLIDKLPWGISMIKLPWNKEVLYVEW